MTPSPAVALNLAQLVALLSHSRLSLRKVSMEVPACIKALARIVAEWVTDTRASTAPLMFFKICKGDSGINPAAAESQAGTHVEKQDVPNPSIICLRVNSILEGHKPLTLEAANAEVSLALQTRHIEARIHLQSTTSPDAPPSHHAVM
jgi:hypothetical protein